MHFVNNQRPKIRSVYTSLDQSQGLTKAWLKRDQMALGVFPNSHE